MKDDIVILRTSEGKAQEDFKILFHGKDAANIILCILKDGFNVDFDPQHKKNKLLNIQSKLFMTTTSSNSIHLSRRDKEQKRRIKSV